MLNQEQSSLADKEEGIARLWAEGIEGYFFKWEWKIRQEMLDNPNPMVQMTVMQAFQKKSDDDNSQGAGIKVDGSEAIKSKLIEIFKQLVTENLALKLYKAECEGKSKA